MDSQCLRCGKRAVTHPLCLACLLEVDDQEFNRWDMVGALINPPVYTEDDEGSECKMCGKPNVYNSPDGMCSSCRTIWNG